MIDQTSRFHSDAKDVTTLYTTINSATGKYCSITSNLGKKPNLIVNFVKKQKKKNNIKGKRWSNSFKVTRFHRQAKMFMA